VKATTLANGDTLQEFDNGDVMILRNGEPHNESGPALIVNGVCFYYLDGEHLSEGQWVERLVHPFAEQITVWKCCGEEVCQCA
jgi:hypothetical protein